jgi:hypothetical protein
MYWRFEVVYSFLSEISSSALNFVINHPPYNGSCSIYPLNGTTSTLFNISCPNWFDEDQIEDYSIYGITPSSNLIIIIIISGYTIDISEKVIIAFSSISDFEVYLPAGNENTSFLNLIVQIRDTLDCITEYNLSTVIITADVESINELINALQNSESELTNNPFIRLLSSGNQNIVSQLLTSLSQEFNKLNIENIQDAVSSKSFRSFMFFSSKLSLDGIPITSISVSSLNSQSSPEVSCFIFHNILIY